jgi:hypothetical protein
VPSPEAYASSMLKGTDLGSSSSGPWIFFNSCVYHSCRISSMYRYITNIAQHLILLLTSFSALASSSSCTGSKNVQVMGFDPSTFLLLHIIQCYKQVNMKNIREERDCIVPASRSCGCDRLPHSGAPTSCSVVSASSALIWL